jgi:hypothetical protein
MIGVDMVLPRSVQHAARLRFLGEIVYLISTHELAGL